MFLNTLKQAIKKTFIFFKENITLFFLSLVLMFIVIWLGNVISAVTSRSILEPISIKVEGLEPDNLSFIRVLAKLSRAGNTINLTRILDGEQNEWNNPSNTFVSKILIGFNSEDLEEFSSLSVKLGNQNFVYSKEEFLEKWEKNTAENNEWFMSDPRGSQNYFVYEAPQNLKAHPWQVKVPLASNLLSSINFKGKEFLIQGPLISSLKFFLLAVLLWLFFTIIFFVLHREENEIDTAYIEKREFIIFTFTVFSAVLLLSFVCLFIKFFYKSDVSAILLDAPKIYLEKFLPAFLPKPVERMQFVVTVLLSPFLLLIFYKLFCQYFYKITKEKINKLYSVVSILLTLFIFSVAYVGLATSNFIYTQTNYFLSGFGKYIYILLLLPFGIYFILFYKKEKYNALIKKITYLFSALLMVIGFLISVISVNTRSLDYLQNVVNHANPIFYPISQVVAGKTLLVNLSSQYGLYPIFLEPIFSRLGLSVFSVTFVMGFLLSITFLFIFLFLRRLVRNNVILLLGFSTIVMYLLDAALNPYPYFQYWPIRTLFPCFFLLISSFYFENKNKFLYYLLFSVSSAAIIWNFDSGIIVFIAWLLALIYLEMFKKDKIIMIKNILNHFVAAIIFLSLVFTAYCLYSYLRSGYLPDLSLFFQYQNLFYSGFMLIAMPFPHTWLLVAIIFLVGLLISIKNWLYKYSEWKNFSIFFLSILGIGLFSYYEGRSHDATFYLPLYLPIILLTIYADLIYDKIIVNKLYGHVLLFFLILFFLFASPLSLIKKSGDYYKRSSIGLSALLNKNKTDGILEKNINFIKDNTEEGEDVIIFAEAFDGLFYLETRTRSALDVPSFTELFFKQEADYVVNFLKCNKDYKVFIYPYSNFFDQSGHKVLDKRVNQTIKDFYKVSNISDADMAFLLNNQENLNNCF